MPSLLRRVRHRLRFPHKLLVDLFLWTAATPLAFLLRFDLTIRPEFQTAFWTFLIVSVGFKLPALLLFRFNLASWRKVTFRDVGTLASGVGVVMVLQILTVMIVRPDVVVPRSLPLLDAGVSLLLFGVRSLRRALDERARRSGVTDAKPVMIVGAGEAGTMLAREMLRHPEAGLTPAGFVDDDPQKVGMRIGDAEVLGARGDLRAILRDHLVDQVLIAVPSADGRFVRETVELVRRAGSDAGRRIETRVIPGVYELLSGEVSIGRLRPVQVEDLLRRAPVQLDLDAIRTYVDGRTVLITGAGGSIGSEIARQLAAFRPGRLLLLGRGEASLFAIDQELQAAHPGLTIEPLLASVRDEARMRVLFGRYRPDVVFHAAAHKHVPLMEAHPEEAILNNVCGTRTVVDLALEMGVQRFVNVSTDKAVNPTSVMGASKRLVEALVRAASERAGEGQLFVSVRFGNVLGSRGSVVPLFERQIADGGPITITDRRMTRYFMTIPEASQLVLQAGALAQNGAIYILDMGEPVRIVDLAEDLIRLSGLEPYEDIDIVEVGARPGEKLFEELTTVDEERRRAVHEKIFVASGNGAARPGLDAQVATLERAARSGDREAVMEALGDLDTVSGCAANAGRERSYA